MLFTIVIPTRNRPELASISLRSALRQDCADFDVLVSDNSSPAQAETLRQTVEALADPRVRYIRPPRELAMGEHWEFAIPQARGDFIGVLTDRMVFKRGALTRMAGVIEAEHPDVLVYSSSALPEPSPPYSLQRPPFTGRVEAIESKDAARLISLSIPPWGVPTMLNTFVSRRLVDEMRSAYPDIYMGAAPDQSFCMHTLDSIERYHYLDEPVMIAHAVSASNGNAVAVGRTNEASKEFVANIQGKGGLTYTPIPEIMANHNVIINEYCRVKAIQRSGRFPELDLERYCDRLEVELVAQGKNADHPDRKRLDEFRAAHGLHRNAPPMRLRLRSTARALLGGNPANRPVGAFVSVDEALAYDESHPPEPNSSVSGFLRRSDRVEAAAAESRAAGSDTRAARLRARRLAEIFTLSGNPTLALEAARNRVQEQLLRFLKAGGRVSAGEVQYGGVVVDRAPFRGPGLGGVVYLQRFVDFGGKIERDDARYVAVLPNGLRFESDEALLVDTLLMIVERFVDDEYGWIDARGRVVIDVGAAVADSVLYFTSKGAKFVYGYEPQQVIFEAAQRNLAVNHVKNALVQQAEVTADGAGGGVAFLDAVRRAAAEHPDAEIACKIDCEGCEYDILAPDALDPAAMEHVAEVMVEYHSGVPPVEGLKKLGFDVETDPGQNGLGWLRARRRRGAGETTTAIG